MEEKAKKCPKCYRPLKPLFTSLYCPICDVPKNDSHGPDQFDIADLTWDEITLPDFKLIRVGTTLKFCNFKTNEKSDEAIVLVSGLRPDEIEIVFPGRDASYILTLSNAFVLSEWKWFAKRGTWDGPS